MRSVLAIVSRYSRALAVMGYEYNGVEVVAGNLDCAESNTAGQVLAQRCNHAVERVRLNIIASE